MISMAAAGTGGTLISAIPYSLRRRNTYSNSKPSPSASAIPTVIRSPQRASHDVLEKKSSITRGNVPKDGRFTLKDYFDQCAELIRRSDGGPPRWFSPLECSLRLHNSPLLLYLPGIVGVGLGLILHHERLGEIFDIRCLHIPLTDRTSFTDLVKLVENTVRFEYSQAPNRPIYLVGESFGACLALSVAARNPDIDILLILANPATSFSKSPLQSQALKPLSTILPKQFSFALPYMLWVQLGVPLKMLTTAFGNRLPFEQVIRELSQEAVSMSSYLAVLSDALTVETLHWKLNLLKSAAKYANSRLHAVKCQTLVLASGQDQLLPSKEEAERLSQLLPNCEIRVFDSSSHTIFLEDGVKLVSILIGASFYRRGRRLDYVLDYLPPTPLEFERIYEPQRWVEAVTSPVMLSTLESGKIVRGLAGVPSEGPVLYVGYHMMLGIELAPLIGRFWTERNILLRGIAHPMMFIKLKDGRLPALSVYDTNRKMGAVPVSASNFYKLFSSKSHVLLFPGGMREALHRKGEEYRLFWPDQSEFVRMAAKFGAKIIPFGSVGEDDIGQVVIDYHDQRRIPYLKKFIEELTDEAVKLRSEVVGEVANQVVHLPIMLPKLPGRFYFYFGKPIETQGRKEVVNNREKADEVYSEVKRGVESCIAFLKEKREGDPYRSIVARLAYQAMHGFDSEVPTFELL